MPRSKERRIWGSGASPGIAEGKAYLFARKKTKFNKRYIARDHVDKEIRRIREALEKSKADLRKIKGTLTHEDVHEHIFILDSHLMILEDRGFISKVLERIEDERGAVGAVADVVESYVAAFARMELL